MYSKLPQLVLGFHGCDKSVRDEVVARGGALVSSQNNYDWLGNGVYFWEQNCERAYEWASQQVKWGKVQQPAVIGAVIDLGHCLNLMDSRYLNLLADEYVALKEEFDSHGLKMPTNHGKTKDKLFRALDCAVIQHLNDRFDHGGDKCDPFDSVRGLFLEGGPIYPGSGFMKKTHIQICVRNPNCIKGYFDPREPDSMYAMP
ncbi:hypothetical protein [Bifidobacterium leontopitheci]|uniref:DUF3990 domain-containing protein n=1 Tax=Bifidobacterium leontopitheci TaxID=2650774 RepID=A0A6I1GDA2_9BIFI|nr:hypothetical protein [Bifidobacterium leontopitheci]KAB7789604.1 hypothetical protein F7D09_1900 [Bifidobacterium leontopitheci]